MPIPETPRATRNELTNTQTLRVRDEWSTVNTATLQRPQDSWKQRRRDDSWPTPNAMRKAADSLDGLSVAQYGSVLRYVADLCDDIEPVSD